MIPFPCAHPSTVKCTEPYRVCVNILELSREHMTLCSIACVQSAVLGWFYFGWGHRSLPYCCCWHSVHILCYYNMLTCSLERENISLSPTSPPPPPHSLSPPSFSLQINLKILLVDGSTHTFPLHPSITGAEVAQHIHHNWPSGIYIYMYIQISL